MYHFQDVENLPVIMLHVHEKTLNSKLDNKKMLCLNNFQSGHARQHTCAPLYNIGIINDNQGQNKHNSNKRKDIIVINPETSMKLLPRLLNELVYRN